MGDNSQPVPSLDDQEESVRIAVKALGDMRNSGARPDSKLGPESFCIMDFDLNISEKIPEHSLRFQFLLHLIPHLHHSKGLFHLLLPLLGRATRQPFLKRHRVGLLSYQECQVYPSLGLLCGFTSREKRLLES